MRLFWHLQESQQPPNKNWFQSLSFVKAYQHKSTHWFLLHLADLATYIFLKPEFSGGFDSITNIKEFTRNCFCTGTQTTIKSFKVIFCKKIINIFLKKNKQDWSQATKKGVFFFFFGKLQINTIDDKSFSHSHSLPYIQGCF